MIISASRRTDIPACYSEWFMQRIRAGYFYRVNPYNSRQVSGFSLQPEDLDAICFWTKNPQPLLPFLDELDGRGFRFYFQFTLNPYGTEFEPGVAQLDERIATFRELANRIGPERVIWRYDPIIVSSVTPVAWHLEQAERIAGRLHQATCRLVFSFCDFYGKGNGRLYKALAGSGITLQDITAPDMSTDRDRLVHGFRSIADSHMLQLFSCSETIDLSAFGVESGACIDGKLIQALFGGDPSLIKDKYQRPACGCVAAVDMGSYNTCRLGCTYCYANFNARTIAGNCRKHFPDSPSLLGRYEHQLEIQRPQQTQTTPSGSQMSLFEKRGRPALPPIKSGII
jgi:hypothetical protein